MNQLPKLKEPANSLNHRAQKGVKLFFFIIIISVLIAPVYYHFAYEDFSLSNPITALIIVVFILAINLISKTGSIILQYKLALTLLLVIIYLLSI